MSRDSKNRLSNKSNYAITFADGYGQNYVNGVFFDEELFKKCFVEKKITPEEIVYMKNAEQKAVLIQEFGYNFILDNLDDKKILHKELNYELFEFNIENLIARAVKVVCPSTQRIFILGVPRETSTETCMGAIAWTFGMKEDEYKLFAES